MIKKGTLDKDLIRMTRKVQKISGDVAENMYIGKKAFR